jgi:hypothetical protein
LFDLLSFVHRLVLTPLRAVFKLMPLINYVVFIQLNAVPITGRNVHVDRHHLEESLQVAYTKSCFEQTRLHCDLWHWQNNNRFIALRDPLPNSCPSCLKSPDDHV